MTAYDAIQLELLPREPITEERLARDEFSHAQVCEGGARQALEARYAPLMEETDAFSRRLVSFQGNRQALVHSWMKYREGFSAELVGALMRRMGIQPGDTLLEPFCGSATTLLTAKMHGVHAVGIELLPVCHLTWRAKAHVAAYDLGELQALYHWIETSQPTATGGCLPSLHITEGAFSAEVEQELLFYREWAEQVPASDAARTLLRLLLVSILEEVSFTRKDGQYLRWDFRASKVQARNQTRAAQGKKPLKKFDKGTIPTVKEALLGAFQAVLHDLRQVQALDFPESTQTLLEGSALLLLPTLEAARFDGVITSPPYCNRYDYTRTYALELAYLGVGESGIRALRQSLLSCTVENRNKESLLRSHYRSLGQGERYAWINEAIRSNAALAEVKVALQQRWERGEINNKGVLPMVQGYFTELGFVIAELYRLCRTGAQVAIVNDNVRYGGEVIPVDTLSTDLAAQVGFEPLKIWVLPQRKGNSSQQMGRFGRVALRKSITLWRKP